ncbi:MAG: ATP-binding protein [Patescibacteria group bacterium]
MELFCPWETAQYFVYSSNIPTLFFYSHIPAIVVALIAGFIVFYRSGKSKVGASLLAVSGLFSLWCIFDLIIWATNRPDVVLFFWSLQILLEPLVYLLCFYLIYLFAKNQDLSFKWKLLGILLYSPVIFLLSSQYNLVGVDSTFCNAIEGFIAQYFTYIIELIFVLSIIIFTTSEYRKTSTRKKEVVIFGLGVILFLIAFSSGNVIGSFTEDWNLAQIGLIGMPIFIGFLSYLIIRFHTFNIKLLTTQVLVWGSVFMIGAQFFFIKVTINFILNAFTFIGVIILGQFLIRSIKKEIRQKEELHIDTEILYSKNSEITTTNKNLSILRKLYQISLLTIDPETLSKKISDAIRGDLNLEFVGIFDFNEKEDTLEPFNFSKSERLMELTTNNNFMFKDFNITQVQNKLFLKKAVYDRSSVITNNIRDVWGGTIDEEKLKLIENNSHIKTVILYPLVIENRTLGILIIGVNRDYDTLNEHEKESIKSCVDVVSVALDKAYLYTELQTANINLEKLLKQRESLMHLINHKVKGAFTRSKYIFAGMLDGTFGEVNAEIKKRAQEGLDSDDTGITTIDLVLNATNMQKGTIKYEMKEIDLKDLVLKKIEKRKIQMNAKGLEVDTDIKDDVYKISGDEFWIKEAVNNLIENSIRYTRQGKITVGLEKKENKIIFSVKDTGVGITEEDKKNLFTEGGRGKNSVKINTDSTGYGLYSVKLIVEGHRGRVWAESEGEGMGSTFYMELPIL